jgi:hypothetical protein
MICHSCRTSQSGWSKGSKPGIRRNEPGPWAHHCWAGAEVGDHHRMEIRVTAVLSLDDPNPFDEDIKKQSGLPLQTEFHPYTHLHTYTLAHNHTTLGTRL